MNNDFLIRYETDLINKTTKEVTEQVTEQVREDVRKTIAKNLKDMISDEEIARSTGLSLEEVKNLSPQP